jgi:hypothetical protein
LRSKLALQLSIGDSEMVVAGDTYNVVFRGEDGQPLRIPLAVYEALPKGHLVVNQNAPANALKVHDLADAVPEVSLLAMTVAMKLGERDAWAFGRV